MQDITELSLSDKMEIATYIREDTLKEVNRNITPVKPRVSFYTMYGKRFFDIIIGLSGVVICLPINLIVAIVTYFDVGFPIIFKQQRVGRNERKFTIYKFRNMTNAMDARGQLLPPSERVTAWGKLVRKTSIDELLNFVSILKGDMSVIGPRPLLDYYAERLNDRHKAIYMVKPGLECPTIHADDYALTWQKRLDNYVWYVENCSFWVDVQLCLRVFAIVFNKKETSRRAQSNGGGLLGYDLSGNIICTKEVPEKYINRFCNEHGFQSLREAVEARKIS